MEFYQRLGIVLATWGSLLMAMGPGLAQDSQGNYTPATYPSDAENPNYAQRLWQVQVSGLNCRQGPGQAYPVVGIFQQGQIMTAATSRGSIDNLPTEAFVKLDVRGKPWLKVEEFQGCFVRAAQRYLHPIRSSF